MGRPGNRIHAEDSSYLNHTPSAVFGAIADLASYSHWWPSVIRFRPLRLSAGYVGSRVEVRSFFLARFLYEIEQTKTDREIVIKYGGDNLSGSGRWTIRESRAGATVSYGIDLAPHAGPLLLLARGTLIERLHSRMMSRAFDGLRAYLARRTAVSG